jgi:hypothetical protein
MELRWGDRMPLLLQVATTLRDAARTRDSQLLLCVRSWASQVQALTCSQLSTVLQLLGSQSQLRCGVIVALWTKVQDRHNLVKVRTYTGTCSPVPRAAVFWVDCSLYHWVFRCRLTVCSIDPETVTVE